MDILVIVGSKQINGNTDLLADSFIEGAKKAKHNITKIHLRKTMVNPCLGCNMCHRDGRICIQNDDMEDIYTAFKKCQMIVLVTPLYFKTMSSSLKCVVDRFYALTGGNYDNVDKKDVALLATAEDTNPDTFYNLNNYYKSLFINTFKWRDRGTLFANGCGGVQSKKIIKETRFLEDAKKFGASIL